MSCTSSHVWPGRGDPIAFDQHRPSGLNRRPVEDARRAQEERFGRRRSGKEKGRERRQDYVNVPKVRTNARGWG